MDRSTELLKNGVLVVHGRNDARVTFRFPDGSETHTTWNQLAAIEQLTRDLQQAYEILLARAQCEHPCRHLPIDVLARIDETLYRSSTAVQRTGDLFCGKPDVPGRDMYASFGPPSAKSRSSSCTSLSTGGQESCESPAARSKRYS